jgi:Uma2 family endonuclease
VSLTVAKVVTANELLAIPDDGFRYELLKGKLVRMSPTGHDHGVVAMNIAGPLHQHVKDNNLGAVFSAETGFIIHENPDTVRAPDVAFVERKRIRQAGKVHGYWRGAPNLAVEVVSPSDTVGSVEEKVKEWLEAGVSLVWVASPKLRTVVVYRSLSEIVTLTEEGILEGGGCVPGFKLAIAEIFADIERE